MIVQVSPLLASRSESLCSLQFASRARRVELGKASARLDGGAEAVKAKAELKKALDGQRAVVADLTATKAAAAAASEAEAAARARATELASRVSSLERDAAAAAEVSRELESVRGLLRAEREIAGSRAEEVDRLKRELKEQVRTAIAESGSMPQRAGYDVPISFLHAGRQGRRRRCGEQQGGNCRCQACSRGGAAAGAQGRRCRGGARSRGRQDYRGAKAAAHDRRIGGRRSRAPRG